MLIRSLRAENFMRFADLRLENLPESGLIGVEGPNESGKSTIGEALLFAFFGRARSGKDCPVEHLIRWGANHLRVEVVFSLSVAVDGAETDVRRDYLIFREIDLFGTNYVKLLTWPEEEEVARGNVQVSDFLHRRLKLDATEFQQAFYHYQSGDEADGQLLSFVENATGVTAMREAADAIALEIERLEREFGHYQRDITRNLRQIERFSQGVSRLEEIERDRGGLVGEQERVDQELEDGRGRALASERLAESAESRERQLKRLASAPESEIPEGIEHTLETLRAVPESEDEARWARECEETVAEPRRKIVTGLTAVANLFADVRDLRALLRSERDRLALDLAEDSAQGLPARLRAARGRLEETEATRRGRRATILVLSSLLVLGGLVVALGAGPEWVGLQESWRFLEGEVAAGAAGAVAVIFFFLLLRLRGGRSLREEAEDAGAAARCLENELEARQADLARLEELLEKVENERLVDFLVSAGRSTPAKIGESLSRLRRAHAALIPGENGGKAGFRKKLDGLARREREVKGTLRSASRAAKQRLKELEAEAKKNRSVRDRAENEIRECRVQAAKKEAAEERNRELEEAAAEIRTRIEDRQLATRLLEEGMRTVRTRIGPTLGRMVRLILPHFTAGRYRDVQLDGSLAVRVFASEKSDFIAARELSGGTHEALMLALRLAFSQSFLVGRGARTQYLFLDEPFKMMDVDRALSTLGVLCRLSPHLHQFFVVQPNYTREQRAKFDCLVSTADLGEGLVLDADRS